MEMAWNGRRFGDDDEGSGLELSLGLPGYFSASPTQAAGFQEKASGGSAAARAKGSNGFKARPAAAAAPVVGWPPVRAFRRNLASASSSKSSSREPSGHTGNNEPARAGGNKQGMFVKVNMDGVPIGRKLDLGAHAGYDTLSAAVDHLFRGLLAAQTSGTVGERQQPIAGILKNGGGGGEYTLVYEDDEGDQMLVGDVPWPMFIASARRLRVLRSSDLNPSSLRAASRKRAAAEG